MVSLGAGGSDEAIPIFTQNRDYIERWLEPHGTD